jgi:hypothetical protein
MAKTARARYTLEFKEEAVRLVTGGQRVSWSGRFRLAEKGVGEGKGGWGWYGRKAGAPARAPAGAIRTRVAPGRAAHQRRQTAR